MSRDGHHQPRGGLGYLQLPTTDLAASITFYERVLGWRGEATHGSFEAPGLIGQWTAELTPTSDGPVLWFSVDDLYPTLERVTDHGGAVTQRPLLDQGERWLVEVTDPSGNRIGLVAPAAAARTQTMLMVRDVEASSRWYQQLLGLVSDHGGPEYERLLADGELALQLHHEGTDHHHGPVGDPAQARGNGVLVWFGAVSDFDGVVERADLMQVEVVREPHRNPPEGGGNGPGHREIWVRDPDGYVVVVASPDGEAWEPA
jgi:predicted enzyme related to lactoylglutathione lyase